MESPIERAKLFAKEAHKDHTESDVLKTPYYFHLQRVARLVQLSGGNNEEIMAAWLHDTVEDTHITLEDIEKEFGKDVATMVNGLTDLTEWKELSTSERKLAQAERVSRESESVRRVKLADQISGGELDARNTVMSKEERLEGFEGVKRVGRACAGISEGLDNLFNEICEEVEWFLDNS